jgi:hypothetical protein
MHRQSQKRDEPANAFQQLVVEEDAGLSTPTEQSQNDAPSFASLNHAECGFSEIPPTNPIQQGSGRSSKPSTKASVLEIESRSFKQGSADSEVLAGQNLPRTTVDSGASIGLKRTTAKSSILDDISVSPKKSNEALFLGVEGLSAKQQGYRLSDKSSSLAGQVSYSAALYKESSEQIFVSWAEIVEEAELSSEYKKTLEVNSVLAHLREVGNKGKENRILIPDKLEKDFPSFYKFASVLANKSGCQLVEQPNVRVALRHPQIWSQNPEVQEQALGVLPLGREREDVGNVAALLDSMVGIPTKDAESSSIGKLALLFVSRVITNVYCEQTYDTPIGHLNGLWRVGATLRDDLISSVTNELGSQIAAKLCVTAIEILYRKLIRLIITNRDTSPQSYDDVKTIAEGHIEKMCVKGTTYFQRQLNTKTVIVTQLRQDLNDKSRQSKAKAVQVKKLTLVRPKVPDGPVTVEENAVYSKINAALGKLETEAMDFSYERMSAGPVEWSNRIKATARKCYAVVAPFSKLVTDRKRIIRADIFKNRAGLKAAPASGKAGATLYTNQGAILPDEWDAALLRIKREKKDDWNDSFRETFSIVFDSSLKRAAEDMSLEQIYEFVRNAIARDLPYGDPVHEDDS